MTNIILRKNINEKTYQEIKGLEKLCSARDNISFKLELEYKLNNSGTEDSENTDINEFLFYDYDNLVGYAGIGDFGGDALEISGMVHPDFRKKRIFSKLFSLVCHECRNRKNNEMLLLCDNKSISGMGFIEGLEADYDHSEYDMFFSRNVPKGKIVQSLSLGKAENKDIKKIAEMDSIFFGAEKNFDFYENANQICSTFMALSRNDIVGKVRLELDEGIGGIYGLGVMPEFRRKGFGREILLLSVDRLKAAGAREIVLQVETNNKKALNLYKNCGFEESCIMVYYRMKIV